MNKQIIFLIDSRRKDYAKQCIESAPEDYVCQIKQKTRTLEQNARFHAMVTDISRQCNYMSKRRDAAQWKIIFVSGHAIVTGKGAEVLPGLEGEFINLRESTASMGVARLSSLMEYVSAWGADHDIKWSDDGIQHGRN